MEFAEKTLDSKLIFDGRVVKLYKDSVELPTGQTSFREVIKHSGGVVILAYKEDKILLVKQFRYPMKEVLYELPAGKLEYGEDPFEAAKRELEEETGYCAKTGLIWVLYIHLRVIAMKSYTCIKPKIWNSLIAILTRVKFLNH